MKPKLSDYVIIEHIAGPVSKVWGPDGKVYALKKKKTNLSEFTAQQVVYESFKAAPCPYEYGDGFMVMEFLEGETLETWIEKQDQTPKLLIKLMESLLELCDKMEMSGIYHPDLKWKNIMVTSDGLKAVDFGDVKHSRGAPWYHVYQTLAPAVALIEAHVGKIDVSMHPSIGMVQYRRFVDYVEKSA